HVESIASFAPASTLTLGKRAGLKGLWQPGLFQNCVGRVSTRAATIHRKVFVGQRAVPYFMVAFAGAHELATTLPQQVDEITIIRSRHERPPAHAEGRMQAWPSWDQRRRSARRVRARDRSRVV